MPTKSRSNLPRKPRLRYIVLVPTETSQVKVYGPYTNFKTAEGDAKAWRGSVELVLSPKEGIK